MIHMDLKWNYCYLILTRKGFIKFNECDTLTDEDDFKLALEEVSRYHALDIKTG